MTQKTLWPFEAPVDGASAKALGAFYTDAKIADFLAGWAIRAPTDYVMDPSFGGGVFLQASCNRLLALGGDPQSQVSGVEIDAQVHREVQTRMVAQFGLLKRNLAAGSFFDLEPNPKIDAVVGNPPFIRYQRFSGECRRRALARSSSAGVKLPALSSSWAPFLVHSISAIRGGGRLAMVVPMECAYASYAKPVLQHLQASFRSITFITFRSKLFPDLSEATMLLLAEGKGQGPAKFECHDLSGASELAGWTRHRQPVQPIDPQDIAESRFRIVEHFLPPNTRRLYRRLCAGEGCMRLSAIARVGIGYVTGANRFFHVKESEARRLGIAKKYLRRAVYRSRAFSGLNFTLEDWQKSNDSTDAGYLLHLQNGHEFPPALRAYLADGMSAGVHETYKCMCRSPWFRVPHVHVADAFLAYMSGHAPRIAVNSAKVVAPNTLHLLRFHSDARISPSAVAAIWQTSLIRLSCEIEGHALGGGMLKLEPREAEAVLIPCPAGTNQLDALSSELDILLRRGRGEQATDVADRRILRDGLGLTNSECQLLRHGADLLRARRYHRGVPG